MESEKILAQRVCRKAERQGLRLSKSRRRDPDAIRVDPEEYGSGAVEDEVRRQHEAIRAEYLGPGTESAGRTRHSGALHKWRVAE